MLLGFTLASCMSVRDYDDNLRGTPSGSRKKPNPGRSPTGRLSTTDVNAHMPCRAHAAPLPCFAVALRSRFKNGMVGTRQGRGMGMARYV